MRVTINLAMDIYQDHSVAVSFASHALTRPRQSLKFWHPPKAGYIKLNVDVAYFDYGSGGLRLILHDMTRRKKCLYQPQNISHLSIIL